MFEHEAGVRFVIKQTVNICQDVCELGDELRVGP